MRKLNDLAVIGLQMKMLIYVVMHWIGAENFNRGKDDTATYWTTDAIHASAKIMIINISYITLFDSCFFHMFYLQTNILAQAVKMKYMPTVCSNHTFIRHIFQAYWALKSNYV